MVPAAASIVVDAPAERVWNVVSDLTSYPRWSYCFLDAHGALRGGEQLALRTSGLLHRGADRNISATVLEVRRHRLIRWLMLPPSERGRIRSEARDGVIFEIAIEDVSTDMVVVRQRLVSTDQAHGWIGEDTDVTRALEASNGALREQVEQATAATPLSHQIDGTIWVSSRHGLRDQMSCRRTGLLTRVSDLVNAWQMPGAA